MATKLTAVEPADTKPVEPDDDECADCDCESGPLDFIICTELHIGTVQRAMSDAIVMLHQATRDSHLDAEYAARMARYAVDHANRNMRQLAEEVNNLTGWVEENHPELFDQTPDIA